MHHIYTTEAFIFGSQNYGEADKTITIFSERFGLIKVSAQGVRELKSKLRYSLQNYSKSRLSLVQTKNGWRITSAKLVSNYTDHFRASRQKFFLVVRIFALLRRLLQGEEANADLFRILSQGLSFLDSLESDIIADFEPVFVLNILHRLGYVGDSPTLSRFVDISSWSKKIVKEAAYLRSEFIKSINLSLKESHL